MVVELRGRVQGSLVVVATAYPTRRVRVGRAIRSGTYGSSAVSSEDGPAAVMVLVEPVPVTPQTQEARGARVAVASRRVPTQRGGVRTGTADRLTAAAVGPPPYQGRPVIRPLRTAAVGSAGEVASRDLTPATKGAPGRGV